MRAPGNQFGQQLGKVMRHDALALLQQHVHVAHLRHAFAEAGIIGKMIAFNQRDGAEMLGQGARQRAGR